MLRNLGVAGLVASLMGGFVLALQSLNPAPRTPPEMSTAATDQAQAPAGAGGTAMTATQQSGQTGSSSVPGQAGTTWQAGPMMSQAQPSPMMGQSQPPGMQMGMGMCGRMMSMMMGGMSSQMSQGGQANQGGQINQPQMNSSNQSDQQQTPARYQALFRFAKWNAP